MLEEVLEAGGGGRDGGEHLGEDALLLGGQAKVRHRSAGLGGSGADQDDQ
ncbi:hypothetical protein [Kitasatospora phosalacinea]|uniref:Uncharacterized protein n=1 Tax=Kitasatospora phosalacinea TaxID=2065 RepID=A0A9W6UNV0_9ACTN|nr:hypothetical protein [Kitasatospora phosalacinea]GLW54688.1 hypothetical protein Kpho01_26990 [Kitasatospora phosalacinea]